MSSQREEPDSTEQPVRGDGADPRAVRDAMAVFAADGQADDETGGDAAAGAATTPGQPRAEDDREPHGPA